MTYLGRQKVFDARIIEGSESGFFRARSPAQPRVAWTRGMTANRNRHEAFFLNCLLIIIHLVLYNERNPKENFLFSILLRSRAGSRTNNNNPKQRTLQPPTLNPSAVMVFSRCHRDVRGDASHRPEPSMRACTT